MIGYSHDRVQERRGASCKSLEEPRRTLHSRVATHASLVLFSLLPSAFVYTLKGACHSFADALLFGQSSRANWMAWLDFRHLTGRWDWAFQVRLYENYAHRRNTTALACRTRASEFTTDVPGQRRQFLETLHALVVQSALALRDSNSQGVLCLYLRK